MTLKNKPQSSKSTAKEETSRSSEAKAEVESGRLATEDYDAGKKTVEIPIESQKATVKMTIINH